MKKKHKGYLVKNWGIPVSMHWLKRAAVADARDMAEGNLGRGESWKDLYQIVKIEIIET